MAKWPFIFFEFEIHSSYQIKSSWRNLITLYDSMFKLRKIHEKEPNMIAPSSLERVSSPNVILITNH